MRVRDVWEAVSGSEVCVEAVSGSEGCVGSEGPM